MGRRPWPLYAELVEEQESAQAVLERELAEDEYGQGRLVGPDATAQPLSDAASAIATWEAAGIRLMTVLDPDYPVNLRTVHDRPPLLFVAGALEPDDTRSLAVIGSRTPTETGILRVQAIAGYLADSGYTVISGLAAGIDTTAHTTALSRQARTIAVIGTGVNHAYPPENAELQKTIAAQGAVVSQFWPDAPPTRTSFPMRNAVMSGLALGSVIVEASETSGTRVQARLALAHGRPVFIARPLLEQDWARALAGRPGTTVFNSPDEIIAAVERLSLDGSLEA